MQFLDCILEGGQCLSSQLCNLQFYLVLVYSTKQWISYRSMHST